MSQSSKPNNDDNDVWQKLFGDDSTDNAPKKGHTTLVSKKTKPKQASASSASSSSSKKRKADNTRSSERNTSSSRTHSQSSSNTQSVRSAHVQSSAAAAAYADGPSNIERLSEFLCTPKHRARLPPPPLHCKFLKYPHSKHRFTRYCASSLELNYAWQLHHDSLFAIPMDLMDPDYYNPLKRSRTNDDDDDDDEEPLNHAQDETILKMLNDRENRRTLKDDTFVAPEQEAFLLQTQYLTGGQEFELTDAQRKEYETDARRHRHAQRQANRRARDVDDVVDVDDEDDEYASHMLRHNPHSLQSVQQTFSDVATVDVHPVRKVKMAKVFDVYPHGDLLDLEYAHIQFDIAPSQQTKKCSFMPKYKEERMQRATQAVQQSVLRCANQKKVERERQKQSKQEMDDDDDEDDDDDDKKKKKKTHDTSNDPDWFSLYATGGKKRVNDDEETCKYEWTAEFKPSAWGRPKQHILVIPKEHTELDEVYYAMFENRISLRHRPTDYHVESGAVPGGGHKGLSEQDKKFFKMQPMHVKLTVPVANSEY